MRNYCKTIGALAAASALVAGTASAEIEYSIGTGYTNEYLFRGLNLGQDLVEASLNAQTEWNGFGLKAGAWYGSYDFSTPFGEYDVDELDLSAEINRDLGFLTAAVGYIYYMNEDQFNLIDDAQEVLANPRHAIRQAAPFIMVSAAMTTSRLLSNLKWRSISGISMNL